MDMVSAVATTLETAVVTANCFMVMLMARALNMATLVLMDITAVATTMVTAVVMANCSWSC